MARRLLSENWRLQSAFLAGDAGDLLSSPGADTDGWHETAAPTTVLCALVKAGVYPDPRMWPNPFRIPDSSDQFNAEHDLARYSHLPEGRNPWRDPWWYRTEFEVEAIAADGHLWLELGSINYRADVWVNGVLIADREQIVGMFRRFRLDITGAARPGRNALAILIHPVDHPGDPDPQTEVFGPVRGFHKDICNDVTEVMSVGYDCFPTVPDRNMGLIQEVYLEITGPVDLRHPLVRTDLDLPDLDEAHLTVSAQLVNASSGPINGSLEGAITSPAGVPVATFRRPTTLLSHETREITVTPTDAPDLNVQTPELWWPNTCGDQPLYSLQLRFEIDGVPSAEMQTPFGIRRIDRELHELDGAHGMRLLVNGKRVFQRGGYVQPEMMFDWDEARVEAELRYLAEANLNYVVFEDIPNPPDWYLDLCDRLGLMFWTCFYDCYWLQYNRPWDVDLQVLEDCTEDIARRYRNHPSLVFHMAQNEGETREDVYEMWRRTVLANDDTRILVPSGSFPDYRTDLPHWFERELPVGLNDYPPKTYSWQLPRTYYQLVREERNWMFMVESASASVPPLESLEQFIPQLRDMPPNSGGNPAYPLDEAWAHFGANAYYEWFDRGLRLLYGEPTDVRDYVWKAHLVAYDQHRGFFEAVHHRMWDITSGFGEWKINSAFPDVQWQLYDWFLRPMVSLFAVRKACASLAIQLCPLDRMVTVINSQFGDATGLRAAATVYDLDLKVLHERSVEADVAANSYADLFTIPAPESASEHPVYFVKLRLESADGEELADNFYWLSPRLDDFDVTHEGDMRDLPSNRPLLVPRETPCLAELSDLPPVQVDVEARVADTNTLAVRVANPTNDLAFFVRTRVLRGDDGHELLPAYWTDNFFSLLPGEEKVLSVAFASAPVEDVHVAVDGWNITPGAFPVMR